MPLGKDSTQILQSYLMLLILQMKVQSELPRHYLGDICQCCYTLHYCHLPSHA